MATENEQSIPLRQNVQLAIRRYLEDMGNCQTESLYQTLLAEVEPPLIEEVLRYTHGNQSRTARILGITRNTLRSKLNRYDIPVTNGKPQSGKLTNGRLTNGKAGNGKLW